MAIEDWSRLMDRGALHHCSEDFHLTLQAIERKVKKLLAPSPSNTFPMHDIKDAIMKCGIVECHWESATETSETFGVTAEVINRDCLS